MHILPIQVYLDSSDFSNLSDPAKRNAEVLEIERQLLSWQSNELIELRFSYAHVIEAAPVRIEDLHQARRRLEYIKEVCGPRCLACPITILEEEVRGVCTGVRRTIPGGLYRNNGDWIPELSEDLFEVPSPDTLVRESLEKMNLGRSARRRMARTYFHQSGRLKTRALESLRSIAPDTLLHLSTRYPLTEPAIRALGSYFLGDGDREAAITGLKESFFDLAAFAQWYEKHWERTTPVSSWLRRIGNDLRSVLAGTAEELKDIYGRLSAIGGDTKTLDRIRHDAFQNLLQSMPINVVRRVAEELHLETIPKEVPHQWETMPSLKAAITIAAHLGLRSALFPDANRIARTSDFGDIVHTFNLPFVDIFRADGFIATVISDAKLPLKTQVVAKFRDLPNSIEKELRNRSVSC